MTTSEDKENLSATATRGVLWTGAGQVLKQVVQVATSVLLARLLPPQDFGLLGMTLVFVGVAQMFSDFGIGSAIVQGQSHDQTMLSSALWANVLVAGLLALLVLLCAPLVASFYATPAIAPLLAAIAPTLVLAGTQVVPQAILYRDMRFADVAKAGFFGSLIGSVVAVLMAWQGFGVWSLVVQPLAGSTVTVFLLFRFTNWLPSRCFSLASIRELVRFSSGVLGTNLLGYAQRNADNLLIGKFLGSAPLGYYQMAYQLMLYPLQQVSSVIVRVLFPTLSKLQHDPARLRQAYLKSISGIAIITFPMMMGLFSVSEDFVLVIFGAQWIPMEPIVAILTWVGLMQSIVTTVGTIYLSLGKIRQMFLVSLVGTPFLISAIALGLRDGIQGVATGYAIAMIIMCYANLHIAFNIISLPFGHFLLAVWRPFISASTMLGGTIYLHHELQDIAAPSRLAACVSFGFVTYIAASMTINRGQLMDIYTRVRSALHRT